MWYTGGGKPRGLAGGDKKQSPVCRVRTSDGNASPIMPPSVASSAGYAERETKPVTI